MAILQESIGRVLVVTIDNPQVKNAFDQATIDELRQVFDGVAYRDVLPAGQEDQLDIGPQGRYRPHVIVLRATGSVFCAGAHLGQMKELGAAGFQENLAAALDMGAMFRAVRNCPVPVVARIQGPAFGGGVGLVAACDLAVAAPEARFAFTEVRLGIVPGVIAPLVIDRIGQRAARACFLTAEPIGAAEALQMGLIDRLAADSDGLDDAVNTVVRSLLKGGPAALSLCKSLLEGAQSLGFSRSAELCARMIADARTKPEGQAALQAFFDKKPAPWISAEPWSLSPTDPDAAAT
jgi:methylglutaconyl-CoA hydratase|nr:enoyl-CoA hydratase-related protein [Candidatus Krumholzibacteria bacterium]